ncbi:MAG: hypothetical protein LBJ90_06095 [Treponema sp.]|nr:hypothetical protein [Treponema sp.]
MIEMLIGNLIGAVFVIAGVIITHRFEDRRRKEEFRKTVFREVHQKQMALYENVIEELLAMIEPKRELLSMSLADFEDKILEFQHKLVAFLGRLSVYGSPRPRNVLDLLSSKLLLQHQRIPREGSAESFEFIRFTRGIVEESLVEFVKVIREVTGADFLNEEVVDCYREITKIKLK